MINWIKTIINNKSVAEASRIVAAALLNAGVLGNAWRMWYTQSSYDQSLWGWIAIDLSLLLAYNYYRVTVPTIKLPQYTALITLGINTFTTLIILYFRLLGAFNLTH